jgi:hypothetical protein
MTNMRLRPIHDASTWYGADMRSVTYWLYEFSRRNIADLEGALLSVCRRGLPLEAVKCTDFPLRSAEGMVRSLTGSLARGCGFGLIRGLPVAKYTEVEAATILWGLGCHIGEAQPQNRNGDLLARVWDCGADPNSATTRGYQTRESLAFHCDNSDVVGLLCYRQARSGGESAVVSSVSVYNEILHGHSEVLPTLYRGFHYDRRGHQAPDQQPFTERVPVYSYYHDDLSCRYIRGLMETAHERMGLGLSDDEKGALDILDLTACRGDMPLSMYLEPGDLQFCNNHVMLHSRTEYEDFEEPNQKRLLFRLWLNVPNIRNLAPDFLKR